ncbi:MAG: hypothetical protein CMO66_05330 [Verrucomicrobiales bacterium]|nr:hypothetical protein [Verrucomicrobiales bacterium]
MSEHDQESDALFEFWAWVEENRLAVIVGVGVALIVGFSIYINRFNATQLVGEAGGALEGTNMAKMLNGSITPESYQAVYSGYPETSAGQRAWLIWARSLLDAGKYEEAQKQFEVFAARHGQSPMKAAADLGRAICLDEGGKTAEAKAAYEQIIIAHSNKPEIQYARLNLAAIFEEEGKTAEARDMLASASSFNPLAPVANRLAGDNLRILIAKYPELRPMTSPHGKPRDPNEPDSNATASESNGTDSSETPDKSRE